MGSVKVGLGTVYQNLLNFPVFWLKFPDFSSLFKIPRLFPDWTKFSHFPGFPVHVGTMGVHVKVGLCGSWWDWVGLGAETVGGLSFGRYVATGLSFGKLKKAISSLETTGYSEPVQRHDNTSILSNDANVSMKGAACCFSQFSHDRKGLFYQAQ